MLRERFLPWWILGPALPLLAAVMCGCSGGNGRVAVSGTVTLDGNPLEAGAISFYPESGIAANSAGGIIKEGKFQLPAASGLKPGNYRVEVKATRKTGRVVHDPMAGDIPEQIPLTFNETGSLVVAIQADGQPVETGRHERTRFSESLMSQLQRQIDTASLQLPVFRTRL